MTRGPFALLAGLVLLSACTSDPALTRCPAIAPGGCPDSPSACDDPTCSALYACSASGAWEPVRTCPPHDAGADARPSDAAGDAPVRDASIDVPGASGGPGCADLQLPDCSLALASACGAGCCGCEDVFVCQDGGWAAWGTCGDGGVVSR